jgi:hypothetical protein
MGLLSSVVGGALSLIGGERRNSAASAQAAAANQLTSQQFQQSKVYNSREAAVNRRFQRSMSNTAVTRQVRDLRNAGINPILSAKYGGASSPGGAIASVSGKLGQQAVIQDSLTPAVNTALSTFQTQSNVDLQSAQAVQAESNAYLNEAKVALTEIQSELQQNLIPASEALTEVAEIGLNLVNAIKSRVNTSQNSIESVMEEGSAALTKAMEMGKEFIGEDVPGAVDTLLSAGQNAAKTLKNMPKRMIDDVKTFFLQLREKAILKRNEFMEGN